MKLLCTLVILISAMSTYGQNSINGKVYNESNEILPGATVVLLNGVDSTMLNFCLTDEAGTYLIKSIKPGSYILQISYVGHLSYSEYIELKSESGVKEISPIVLKESNQVLQEVEIKAEHIPMGIKGDTISYNAAAFKTLPNATVEDLLRILPGIEVERNGNIRAQGEDVKQVLVDGKEFFGNDPKIATKNLQAEAVDKVEVFDKKSEIAEFTGIDDGEEEKTINLKLKEDFKNGGFGNAKASVGTTHTYDSKLNYFRFTPSVQASFIAASNNINEETFTLNDQIDFLGGISNLLSTENLKLLGSERLGDGFNTSSSIGGNFNVELSSKLKLNAHYIYKGVENDLSENTNVNNLNIGNEFITQDTSLANKNYKSHGINTKLNYRVTPLFELIFRNNLIFSDDLRTKNTLSRYLSSGLNIGETASFNKLYKDAVNYSSHTSIRKKFRKKGRNVISTIVLKLLDATSDDMIDNRDNLSGLPTRVNQVQEYQSTSRQASLTTNYTEPLSDKLFMGLEYSYASSVETPKRNYFNVVQTDTIFDTLLSSDYRKEYIYHFGGLSLRRNSKRLKVKVGLKRQWISLDGIINMGDSSIEGDFSQWLPSTTVDFNMKGNKDLSFSYYTTFNAPELEKLLPLPNNTSPNYIFVGNPTLLPEYTHTLNLKFNSFDNFDLTSIFSNVSFTLSQNKIINKTDIDSLLIRFITPVNTEDYKELRTFFSYSRPFRLLNIKYAIRSQFMYSRYNSFLNGITSRVAENYIDFKFSLQNRNTKFMYIDAGIDWNRNHINYELNKDFDQTYFNLDYFLDAEFYLPAGFSLASELHYNTYSSEGFTENPKYYLWTGSISKLFFDNKWELKLSIHDILNQNLGYRRYSAATTITEQSFETIGQYFMIALKYRIGKGKRDNGINIKIEE